MLWNPTKRCFKDSCAEKSCANKLSPGLIVVQRPWVIRARWDQWNHPLSLGLDHAFSAVKLQPLITAWPHRFLLERFTHVLPAAQSPVPPQPEDPSLSFSLPLGNLHWTREDGPRHPSLHLCAAKGLVLRCKPSKINRPSSASTYFPLYVFLCLSATYFLLTTTATKWGEIWQKNY